MKIFSLILVLAVILSSCFFNCKEDKSKEQISEIGVNSKIENYKNVAGEKYEGNIQYILSPNASLMLCISQSKADALNPFPALKYFIYDLQNDVILFEESLKNGNVEWVSEQRLRISYVSGQVKNNLENELYYIYDLKTKKKYIDELIKEKK